jgi:hypothetical protein
VFRFYSSVMVLVLFPLSGSLNATTIGSTASSENTPVVIKDDNLQIGCGVQSIYFLEKPDDTDLFCDQDEPNKTLQLRAFSNSM